MNNKKSERYEEEAANLLENHRDSEAVAQIESFKLSHTLRIDFIQKVYSLLSVQLLITFGWTIFAINNAPVHDFMVRNSFILVLVCILTIITLYALVCFLDFQRTVPYNYIMLAIFTLCESYMVAYICCFTQPSVVYSAGIMTIVVCIALTIYAFTTKRDFTKMGGMLFVILAVFLVAGIFMVFVKVPLVRMVYHIIGVLLFGFYLVYDTQLIMSNKSMAYSVDDYIAATLNLYLDIINIFLEILQLFESK
jgi:FtsH-binding integral membrane protein